MEWVKWLIIGIVIAGIAALIIGIIVWWIKTYNKLVSSTQKVRNQWSQIDVQLKKRYDLIPNLVETVKGYASHEKEVLENVTMWRSRATSATTPEEAVDANNHLIHDGIFEFRRQGTSRTRALGRVYGLRHGHGDRGQSKRTAGD